MSEMGKRTNLKLKGVAFGAGAETEESDAEESDLEAGSEEGAVGGGGLRIEPAAKQQKKQIEVEEEEVEVELTKKEKKAKKKEKLAMETLEQEKEAEPEEAPKKEKKDKKEKKERKEAVVEEEQKDVDPEAAKKAKKEAMKRAIEAAMMAELGEDEPQPRKKDKKRKRPEHVEEPQAQVASTTTAAESEAAKKELTLYVSGIPWSVTEDALHEDFSKCGPIKDFNMVMNDEGKPKGIAFITFKTNEAVTEALKKHGLDYGGRTLSVKRADKAKKGKGKGGSSNLHVSNAFEVWICGLPFETEKDILRKDFAACGEIESFNMLVKPDGTCRGVAFISYKTLEGAEKACEFNGTEYSGRWIQCELSARGSKGKDKGKSKGSNGKGKEKGKSKDKGKGKAGKGNFGKGRDGEEAPEKKSKIAHDEEEECLRYAAMM